MKEVVFDCCPLAEFPNLTHLRLTNLSIPCDLYYTFFEHAAMPRPTHLASIITDLARVPTTDGHLTAATQARLGPQPESLWLGELLPCSEAEASAFIDKMTRLRTLTGLSGVAPASDCEGRSDFFALILNLEHSLTTVDVSAQPFSTWFSSALIEGFTHEDGVCPSVADLRLLRLPRLAGLVVAAGDELETAERDLREAASLAEAHGVQVEWV